MEEEILSCVANLAEIGDLRLIYPNPIYRLIAKWNPTIEELEQFTEETLPKIYELIAVGKIKKDLFFLSLLTNEDSRLLSVFLQHEQATVEINVENPASLFDYSFYKQRHWIFEVINSDNCRFFTSLPNITYKFNVLKLLNISNKPCIDLEMLQDLIMKISPDDGDSFVSDYIDFIKHLINTVQFIKGLNLKADDSLVYSSVLNNSLLDTFANFIDLAKPEIWDYIATQLKQDELEKFIAFTITLAFLKCLQQCSNPAQVKDEITGSIESIKEKLLGLNNLVLLVEILENIFCLAFLRQGDGFFCTEPQLRLILSLLRTTFEEIRRKNRMTRDMAEFKRFLELNKYVSDAIWRLEIITEIRNANASHLKRGLMYYMLSSPEALINLCLKSNNLEKAGQVIQIFDLEEDDLFRSISQTFKYAEVRRKLSKLTHTSDADRKLKIHQLIQDGQLNSDADVFDLFLTFPFHHDDFIDNRSIPEDKFISNVVKIFRLDSLAPQELFASAVIPLDFHAYQNWKSQYEKLGEIYDRFRKQMETKEPASAAGNLNLNHAAVKTLAQLEDVFKIPEQIKYSTRLINYLKIFGRIFYIERNNSDLISKGREVSVFEILSESRLKLISKLMYERNLDGTDFDWIFSKLKLDLTYYLAAPSFPQINLNFRGQIEKHSTLRKPKRDAINYVQKRNWLLAYLLNKIHTIHDAKIDASEIRVKTLYNLIQLCDTQTIKKWFDDNDVVAILQHNFSEQIVKLSDQLQTAGEDVDWVQLYQLFMSIPEIDVRKFETIKDALALKIIKAKAVPDYYKYVSAISDDQVKINILLSELHNWPGNFCVDVIKSELAALKKNAGEFKVTLETLCKKIELCNQLNVLYPDDFWHDIDIKCATDPGQVLADILRTANVELLVKFIDAHQPLLSSAISADYFESLLQQNIKIGLLLDKLPVDFAAKICSTLLHRLQNLQHLDFIVEYLSTKISIPVDANIKTSLRMLSCFSAEDLEQHWSLISDPLGIIEVLLMNTKLDKLGQMLELIGPELEKSEYDEDEISTEKIDALLRRYAEKSLEFQLVTHQRKVRTPENKILLSLDSLSLERKVLFTMPESVPDKSEWIEDDNVVECMCCQQVTFSMFNRRHHCRRCGRVVCWSCSSKKMQVATYGDISVRVCLDCYEQTNSRGPSVTNVSSNSISDEYWLLTDDLERNNLIRDEFSYENAPSVSLCLSILKYHSISEECPKFLLNQCDNILKLLQPIGGDCSVEIDYNLIIKMLISLAVAAKVISNKCTLQWGTSLADKILSQAELLGLLAERACLNLIPKSTQSSSPYIDSAILRRIRDKLLEQEQWNLALEVSTKAGLDNTAVFAMWGKSCLKAGNLHLARVKFQRCFEKSPSEFSSLDTSSADFRSYYSETRPYKNPPLLNEIVQILESTTTVINKKILKNLHSSKDLYASSSSLTQSPNLSTAHYETSICIINKLRNLGAVAAGNYSFSDDAIVAPRPHMENIFHDECVFYLTKYGTHLSLCQFYVKHGEFENALYHIVENHLNFDVFIEIYMACLKDGLIDVLHENILNIDSTFDVWKDYLRCLCIHLEKQAMFHSLYQLQLFMGDFVRAAMTCIKFYSDGANSFEELSNRVEYLLKARDHLKQGIEQEQWVEVASVRRMSDSIQETFEEKALTNPALVMKMNAKEVDRHINTIVRQIELVKFLVECEKVGKTVVTLLSEISCIPTENLKTQRSNSTTLPTLFGSVHEKMQLAMLAIICGGRIEDGFVHAHRIIHAYNLKAVKVYCEVGRQLAREKRHSAISQLVQCIHNSGEKSTVITEMCDEMLALAARTLGDNHATDGQIEDIIKHISDRTMKINSYIETKQLRSAFLVAAKYSRFSDIQRISREAELLNKPDVKKMCQKFLLTRAHVT